MRSACLSLSPVLLLVALAATVAPAGEKPARLDAAGDPLPAGALARLGTTRFRDGNPISAVAPSPDGKALAVMDAQGGRLFDLAAGKELRALKSAGSVNFSQVSYSPDGKLIAASDYNGRVQFWDPATGEPTGQLAPLLREKGVLGRTLNGFSLSADGKYAATATDGPLGGNARSEAAVHEVATGKETVRVELVHNQAVRTFLSPDGKVMATTGHYLSRGRAEPPDKEVEINATVQVWDAVAGKELHKLRAEGTWGVTGAAFAPDGKQLVVATAPGILVVWDPSTGKELRRLTGRRNLSAFVAFSPDGKTIAAAGADGTVQTWDAADGKRLGVYELPRANNPRYAFTTGGRLLALAATRGAVLVWDVRAERLLTPTDGHLTGIADVRYTPDGNGLIAASWDGVVILADGAGKEDKRVQLHGEGGPISGPGLPRMSALRLSPDGKFALGSETGGLSLFELGKGREVCSFIWGHAPFDKGVCFSADGARIAMATPEAGPRAHALRLFDVATGRELRKGEGGTGDPRAVATSPDGKAAATASNGGPVNEIRGWDARAGKSLWRADSGNLWIHGLAFSPDGKTLAAVDQAGTVILYAAAAGHELRRLPAEPGAGNPGGLTFSPDGRLVAVATYVAAARKAATRLYEVATGTVRHEFTGHTGPVTAVAFSPDRKRLATGSSDTTVLVWDLTGRADGEAAKGKPGAEELDRLWADLGDTDGRAAFKAMARLGSAPEEAVALLKKHVKPAGEGGASDEVAKLIAALDDDNFDTRQAAHKQLAALGSSAQEPLKKALAAKPSAEAKRAIEDLLEKLKDKGPAQGPPPEAVRSARAVEVLEDLGTPEARKLLEGLAKGRAEAPLTAAAKEALARLGRAEKP